MLAGDKDRFTPKISCIQVHEKIPNSKLEIIQGGHYFPLEKAPEVNNIIIEFLES